MQESVAIEATSGAQMGFFAPESYVTSALVAAPAGSAGNSGTSGS